MSRIAPSWRGRAIRGPLPSPLSRTTARGSCPVRRRGPGSRPRPAARLRGMRKGGGVRERRSRGRPRAIRRISRPRIPSWDPDRPLARGRGAHARPRARAADAAATAASFLPSTHQTCAPAARPPPAAAAAPPGRPRRRNRFSAGRPPHAPTAARGQRARTPSPGAGRARDGGGARRRARRRAASRRSGRLGGRLGGVGNRSAAQTGRCRPDGPSGREEGGGEAPARRTRPAWRRRHAAAPPSLTCATPSSASRRMFSAMRAARWAS